MSEKFRKCCLCGTYASDNPLRTLHRFPKPGMLATKRRAQAWAEFCFPNEDWSSLQPLQKLHATHKMLCSEHFDDCDFTNKTKTRVNLYALPRHKKPMLNEVSDDDIARNSMKCCLCGLSEGEITLHRFPRPGKSYSLLRARVWAEYCFPDEDWTSKERLESLYSRHKVLCSNHFDDTSYTDSMRKRLNIFSIPTDAQPLLQRLRKEEEDKAERKRVAASASNSKGQHLKERCRIWAKVSYPKSDMNLIDVSRLHDSHKMLCGKHFEDSSYTDSTRTRLNKFALPIGGREMIKTLMEDSELEKYYAPALGDEMQLRQRYKEFVNKTKNTMNAENIDPSLENTDATLENTDPSGLDYSFDSEDDSFQDNISVAETNIMDVEIMDYDDQVETLQSTNSIPMPAVQAIEFSSMSSNLKASIDFHNYSKSPQTEICRLCCSIKSEKKTFYNIYTDNISEQMDQCLHITATKDDRLPSYICQDCYDNLQKTHSFYSSVHEVDTILKSQVGENTCPSDNIRDKVSTAQDNDKLITAQDNDKLITAQDDDKLIINIEINKEQSQFHCPFCKYGYRNKSCIIKHINQFHFQTTASDNEMEETHRDNSNIQTQSLNNNTSLSTYTTVPVPLHPHITHSDLSNDEQLFIDLNVSDLIIFNKKHSEKYLTESYDSTYNIPGVSDYCDVTCEDDNVDASETVDLSLLTDFIIEESIDGNRCAGCDRYYKNLHWKRLHQCIEHRNYVPAYKCLQCKQACRDTLQIAYHLMSAHQISTDNQEASMTKVKVKCLFSCEFCLQYYVSVKELKDHRQSCASFKNDEMKCGCGVVYSNFTTFRQHYIEHHEKDDLLRSPECSIFYQCNICDALFSSLRECLYHSKKSHGWEKKMAVSCGLGLHKLKLEVKS